MLYQRIYWGRDLTYFIRPGPGKNGEVLGAGLVGVVGDVRHFQAVDLSVPVPHHLLHARLPHLPVVLPFEGDQVLSVLQERDDMRCDPRDCGATHVMLLPIDEDSPDCLVFAAALRRPHLRQTGQLGAPGEFPHVGSWRQSSSQGPIIGDVTSVSGKKEIKIF